MAQQQGGGRPPYYNSGQQPQYRYVQPQQETNTRQGLTKAQRQARIRRRQELLRRRKRRRVLIGIGVLALLVIIFFGVWILHGVNEMPVDDELDELDLGELDDEAEEALYDGPPVTTIAFVGDISTSADQIKAVTGADGNLNFPQVFADVEEYFQKDRVDYVVGDFETTMVDGMAYGTEPYYNAPIELAGTLRGLGFRLVSTANTYALNNGIEGVISTKNYLTQAKLRSVGTYLSQEERDENGGAYIRNIHKIKFAFLSYTKGTDSVTMPEGCEYALNTLYTDYADYWSNLRENQILQDIQAVKDAGAEVIVVLLHWGSEYNRTVSEPQKELKDLLLQNGVDVIIGSHSHLVNKLGYEDVDMPDGTKKRCFVAYGLGDFYTDPAQENAQQSLILNLTFSKGDNGQVTITNANYIPIYMRISQENGLRQFHVIDVYRNLAELKRIDMTSEQSELFNQLLDTVDTMHNYGGAELDVGPLEKDRRIVDKAIEEGEIPAAEIRELKKQEEEAAKAAAREAAEARENGESNDIQQDPVYQEPAVQEPEEEPEEAPEENWDTEE